MLNEENMNDDEASSSNVENDLFFPTQSQRIASNASNSNTFSQLRQKTQQNVNAHHTFKYQITSLCLSQQNASIFYVGLANGNMVEYDWREDKEIQTHQKRHKGALTSMILSNNTHHLVSGGDDGRIIVSPVRDLTVTEWEAHHSMPVQEVRLMAQQREGEIVVASGASLMFWNWKVGDESSKGKQHDGQMRILNEQPASNKPLQRLVVHTNTMNDIVINSFDVHPYRSSVWVCACSNGNLSMWDLNVSRHAPIKTLQYSRSPIWKVRFAREEEGLTTVGSVQEPWCALYTSHDDGSVLRWEIPRDFSSWAMQGSTTRSPMTLEYKHELSAVLDFALCDENGGVQNENTLVLVTEFGDIIGKPLRKSLE